MVEKLVRADDFCIPNGCGDLFYEEKRFQIFFINVINVPVLEFKGRTIISIIFYKNTPTVRFPGRTRNGRKSNPGFLSQLKIVGKNFFRIADAQNLHTN